MLLHLFSSLLEYVSTNAGRNQHHLNFLDEKDGPVRVKTIDGTTPLDNTGGYSQMLNSSNSQFNDSEGYNFLKDLMSVRQDSIGSPTRSPT